MAEIEPPALDVALADAGFVRGLARALLGADPQVDDVVQETWIAAMQGGPDRPGKMRSWLGSVVRKKAAGVHRKRGMRSRHAPHLPRPGGVPSTEEVVAKEEMRRKVVEGMLQVSEPSRSALLLRYYEDLPPREVAARLDVPVETARTRIKRGLAALRSDLDERAGGRRCWLVLVGSLAEGPHGIPPKPVPVSTAPWASYGGLAAVAVAAGFAAFLGLQSDETAAVPGANGPVAVAPAQPGLTGKRGTADDPNGEIPVGTSQIEGWVLGLNDGRRRTIALYRVGPMQDDARLMSNQRPHVEDRTRLFEHAPDRTTTTNAAGRFVFDRLAVGEYMLSIDVGSAKAAHGCFIEHDGERVERSILLGGTAQLSLRAVTGDGSRSSSA